jgi:YesN/AraC family two-component response regulator
MIADDVLEMRRSTRLMLTQIPEVKVVAIAHDGRQAVEMAIEHKPDIILMDVSMPELDGVTAIEEILKRCPHTGCIVISGERDSEVLRRAMASGAKGYLVKPITTEELTDAVHRVGKLVQNNRLTEDLEKRRKFERKVFLQQLATEYVKARCTDDKALAVFEELTADPECEVPWLQSLAVIYVFRQEWEKLKSLADRLEG